MLQLLYTGNVPPWRGLPAHRSARIRATAIRQATIKVNRAGRTALETTARTHGRLCADRQRPYRPVRQLGAMSPSRTTLRSGDRTPFDGRRDTLSLDLVNVPAEWSA